MMKVGDKISMVSSDWSLFFAERGMNKIFYRSNSSNTFLCIDKIINPVNNPAKNHYVIYGIYKTDEDIIDLLEYFLKELSSSNESLVYSVLYSRENVFDIKRMISNIRRKVNLEKCI